MLIIYTGDGKGKTSACVGQCIRALGQGYQVVFAQFMKRDGQAGEQKILRELLNDQFLAGGAGFFRSEAERNIHRGSVCKVLKWIFAHSTHDTDMLILDEALYALGSGLLEKSELEDIISMSKKKEIHLVLSGRGVPEWLEEKADLISSVTEIKHPWRKGIGAQRGIEF